MTTTLIDAIEEVGHALDGLANALAEGTSATVLQAEEPLGAAVTRLARYRSEGFVSDDGPALRQAIALVHATLTRCETLGRSAADFQRALFPDTSYGPRGLQLVTPPPARRLTSIS